MNVGIGNEAAWFLNWEYINGIFIAVCEVVPPTLFSSSLMTAFDLKVFHCANYRLKYSITVFFDDFTGKYKCCFYTFLFMHSGLLGLGQEIELIYLDENG